MKRKTLGMLALLSVCSAAAVARGGDIEIGEKTAFTTSFKIEVKATAAEQFAYALSLTRNLALAQARGGKLTADEGKALKVFEGAVEQHRKKLQ